MDRISPIALLFSVQLTCLGQVQNPGFEAGMSGWLFPCACAPYQFTGDVPPAGGSTSLSVGIVDDNCLCSALETVYQPIPWLYPGQWVLTAWIKNADPGNIPGAAVRITEGPAFGSPILADEWSSLGAWEQVTDTFLVTAGMDTDSLRISLIPDDGNAMPAGLFASFDNITIEPLLSTSLVEEGIATPDVFPIPAGNGLSVVTGTPPVEVTVLDARGRLVHRPVVHRDGAITSIDITPLTSGSYLLRVVTSAEVRVFRFVKG